MEATVRTLGAITANALLALGRGEDLVARGAWLDSEGSAKLELFISDDLQKGTEYAQKWLESPPKKAIGILTIHDGFLTLPNLPRTDCLFLNARALSPRGFGLMAPTVTQALKMALPYRSTNHEQGLAFYRPKFLGFDGSDAELDAIEDAFFAGLETEEEGNALWNQYSDDSM